AHFVAQARRQLKLELLGRQHHLLRQVGNRLFELFGALGGDALVLLERRRGLASAAALGARIFAALRKQLGRVGLLAGELIGDVGDLLAQGLRVNAVFAVVGELDVAATVGFFERALHRIGDAIGIHVYLARHVSSRATDGLNQRGRAAQE